MFRDYGMDPSEIHMLRIIFHANMTTRYRGSLPLIKDESEWTPQAILAREEAWLNSSRREDMNQNVNAILFPNTVNLVRNNAILNTVSFIVN
jgi:hypothetical protein